MLQSLTSSGTLAAGKLHAEAGGEAAIPRREFERIVGGLARSGLVRLEDATFEKDGKAISFRKVHITMDGRAEAKSGDPAFTITEMVEAENRPGKKQRRPSGKKKKESRRQEMRRSKPPAHDAGGIEKALKAWRLAEAKRQGVPAFRVMTDQTLRAIAEERPETTNSLLSIHGMGLRGVEKYGAAIFRVLATSK
jgi:DNA topoisomerase-3